MSRAKNNGAPVRREPQKYNFRRFDTNSQDIRGEKLTTIGANTDNIKNERSFRKPAISKNIRENVNSRKTNSRNVPRKINSRRSCWSRDNNVDSHTNWRKISDSSELENQPENSHILDELFHGSTEFFPEKTPKSYSISYFNTFDLLTPTAQVNPGENRLSEAEMINRYFSVPFSYFSEKKSEDSPPPGFD